MPSRMEVKEGDAYGRWTVLFEHPQIGAKRWFECVCECGTERRVSLVSIRSGASISCGCARKGVGRITMPIGEKFGMLTVIGKHEERGVARVRCDCGTVKHVRLSKMKVKNGRTISCGCYNSAPGKGNIHGLSRTRINRIHSDMKQRCSNPNSDAYRYYGGKGVRVCDEWDSVEAFAEWAFDGNYEPANCRWITRRENSRLARSGKKRSKS